MGFEPGGYLFAASSPLFQGIPRYAVPVFCLPQPTAPQGLVWEGEKEPLRQGWLEGKPRCYGSLGGPEPGGATLGWVRGDLWVFPGCFCPCFALQVRALCCHFSIHKMELTVPPPLQKHTEATRGKSNAQGKYANSKIPILGAVEKKRLDRAEECKHAGFEG